MFLSVHFISSIIVFSAGFKIQILYPPNKFYYFSFAFILILSFSVNSQFLITFPHSSLSNIIFLLYSVCNYFDITILLLFFLFITLIFLSSLTVLIRISTFIFYNLFNTNFRFIFTLLYSYFLFLSIVFLTSFLNSFLLIFL